MDKADIAALLAVGAAFFIAIGDVIHQRSAHEVTDEPVSHVDLFLRLLRDGRWWLGSVVAAVGFALQAAALGLGSVLLVQAVLVTSLLFALPINARLSRRRVTRWEWTWAALLAAAVAVIVTVGNPTAGHSRASFETWTAVIAVLGGRADVVRPRQRGAAGSGVRRAVGFVRGADQGSGGPPR
jgi:drug/metabolite transporter (DMT)-like permease